MFTLTNYSALSGLSAVSNNNANVTIGLITYPITNISDWNISSTVNSLTFIAEPGVVINPGIHKFVGVTIS